MQLDYPMMDPPEVEALSKVLDNLPSHARVLEWGGGASTLYWPSRFPQLIWVTVEHDRNYYEAIIAEVASNVVVLHLSPPEYYDLQRHHLGKFDLVIVDSWARIREKCLKRATNMLSPDGAMILHDTHHPPYISLARKYFQTEVELCPPNASGKRGLAMFTAN